MPGTAPAQAKNEDWESSGREEFLVPDTEDRGMFLISTEMALNVVNRGEAAPRQPLALLSWEGLVLGRQDLSLLLSSHLHSRKLPGYLRKE